MHYAIKCGGENTRWQKPSKPSLFSRTKILASEVKFLVNNHVLFLVPILILMLKDSPLLFFFLFIILQGCKNKVTNILQCEIQSLKIATGPVCTRENQKVAQIRPSLWKLMEYFH